MTGRRDPSTVTFNEVVDHVRAHMTPELELDTIDGDALRAIIYLALHAAGAMGLMLDANDLAARSRVERERRRRRWVRDLLIRWLDLPGFE